MKPFEIQNELIEAAKQLGITVVRERGTFRSGYCKVGDKRYFIVNVSTTPEILNSQLALALKEQDIDGVYLKPVVREFLDNHAEAPKQDSFNFVVNY